MTPAAHRRRSVPKILLKLGLAAGLASAVIAQPPPRARTTDDAVALRVRQALDAHPELRPHKLNLLVTVIDGVVVIGGAVPDEKLVGAIESAAKVDGAARVKVTVWTQPTADPLAAKIEEKLAPRPFPTPPAPPVVLSLPTDPRPTAAPTARTAAPSPALLQPPVVAVERTSRSPHLRTPGAEPPEYTPIPATNLPTEPVAEPLPATPVRAAIPEPERATDADGWKRDPRFARLTVEVRNGTAVIGGRAATREAAWELAEVVRGWPAVERVVIGRVELR
ncbi:MAG: BON domain-containing protein [Fimbriiglobus sp.]|jgi:osmotically-inducible protein OsmY|nr:BON domain-containing protein [Fimbriiglobus sp.]